MSCAIGFAVALAFLVFVWLLVTGRPMRPAQDGLVTYDPSDGQALYGWYDGWGRLWLARNRWGLDRVRWSKFKWG